eukprot:TRINITY_DN7668_c1_g1_i3.p1 TRINITY_DN7668_c1_g1~~TRINITY_DN7668_c1_g1_i3.p1  ORF type:complete len:240 (+),score=38.86 TRINITY_DN7668_c1_g1_i3:503-1222(+)
MSVRFSQNDEFIAAASNDNGVRIWSLGSSKSQLCFLAHTGKVYAAEFSYDSTKVVSGGYDRDIRIWDIKNVVQIRKISCGSSCNDLILTRDANIVISGHVDGHLRFWDPKSGDQIYDLSSVHSQQITSVSLSPDGWSVLTFSRDNTLKIVDIRRYEALQVFTNESFMNPSSYARACFSPDGSYICAGSHNGIHFWNVFTGLHETSLAQDEDSSIFCCSWNPNGSQVLSSNRHGYIYWWR